MASYGLIDQNRLEGSSNYVIWKERIKFLLDEYDLKAFMDNVVVVSTDPDQNKKYKSDMANAKRLILDGVKYHIISHIDGKDTAKQIWETLSLLYEGNSEQQKMYLEQKLWTIQMQKGECITPFLTRLQEIRDQLAAVGSTPIATTVVRLALNVVAEEWQVFVESILSRAMLPSWEEEEEEE